MNVLKLTKINALLLLVTLTSVTTFLRDEGFKAADAERLGKCLDGPSTQLEELKRNNHDFISLLCDIIQCWLSNDFSPSWNSLAVALDKCDYRFMADKIRQPGKLSMHGVEPLYLGYPSYKSIMLLGSCRGVGICMRGHVCVCGRGGGGGGGGGGGVMCLRHQGDIFPLPWLNNALSPTFSKDIQPTPTMETGRGTVNLEATDNLDASPSPTTGEIPSAFHKRLIMYNYF